MEIQLWRNATVLLNFDKVKFLIDPMLGTKKSFGVFPWTNDDHLNPLDDHLNPLTDLPFTKKKLDTLLDDLDAVVISHLHPDHWDERAVQLLSKKIPIICPYHIAKTIERYGFTNVMTIKSNKVFKGVQINLTNGKHGTGEIGEKMGKVNGFVFSKNNRSIYFSGDSIWCDEVKQAIEQYTPENIVVAGGAATFAVGAPVTMTSKDVVELCRQFPKPRIFITHLEAISPCQENRKFTKKQISKHGYSERCFVLDDGERYKL